MLLNLEEWGRDLLAQAGIEVDGPNPWDIQIHDKRTYMATALRGHLGFAEAYVKGWWSVRSVDQFTALLLLAEANKKIGPRWRHALKDILHAVRNFQSDARAFMVGERHYDLGQRLYEPMLGKVMGYSCGYWPNQTTLEGSQRAKFDLVCKKLGLKCSDRVLEIGCGWGEFAKHAAENYGAVVTGYTVSKEQAKYAEELCEGLSVKIVLEDYRKAQGQYDHVVSIAMFEAVGPKNFRTFMEVARRCLKPGGRFLLHTITGRTSATRTDDFIDEYVFPNGVIPSNAQIMRAAEGLFDFVDAHNIGPDYDRTLMEWNRRFQAAWPDLREEYAEVFKRMWPKLARHCDDDGFKRMWEYYLLICAASFRVGKNQLHHYVFTTDGVPANFVTVR